MIVVVVVWESNLALIALTVLPLSLEATTGKSSLTKCGCCQKRGGRKFPFTD